jgi:hypothetical protein
MKYGAFVEFYVPNGQEISDCSVGNNMEGYGRGRVYGAVPSICLKERRQIPQTPNEYVECPDEV